MSDFTQILPPIDLYLSIPSSVALITFERTGETEMSKIDSILYVFALLLNPLFLFLPSSSSLLLYIITTTFCFTFPGHSISFVSESFLHFICSGVLQIQKFRSALQRTQCYRRISQMQPWGGQNIA